MNLNAEKFREIADLYPETAQNLKLRALEKRSIFMYYKRKALRRRRKWGGIKRKDRKLKNIGRAETLE